MDYAIKTSKVLVLLALALFLYAAAVSVTKITGSVAKTQQDIHAISQNFGVAVTGLNNTERSIQALGPQLVGQTAQLTKQTLLLESQLTLVAKYLDAGATGITYMGKQASASLDNANYLLGDVDLLAKDSSKAMKSADAFISDPDIPKTIRSTRALVDQSALTMSHVRSVADTVAKEAPEIANSVAGVTASADGIAGDIHKVTADFTKPKPWYRKLWGVTVDAAGLARFF